MLNSYFTARAIFLSWQSTCCIQSHKWSPTLLLRVFTTGPEGLFVYHSTAEHQQFLSACSCPIFDFSSQPYIIFTTSALIYGKHYFHHFCNLCKTYTSIPLPRKKYSLAWFVFKIWDPFALYYNTVLYSLLTEIIIKNSWFVHLSYILWEMPQNFTLILLLV